ncbi:MAG: zinc-binding dehydrogenase, partial [Thermoproteota archaeon]|nr:zinc-binding dehydrogenase [Thermoproteota archaeon]
VGQVIEPKSSRFKVGEYLRAESRWRQYWIGRDSEANKNNITEINASIGPLRYFLGLPDITGITAYVDLTRIDELKENDPVFVSSAAGAVGSVACQISKINRCHVVGSCGSDAKTRWLVDEIKVDNAFNYKNTSEDNISSEKRKSCPSGIDVYFGNVGGKHLEVAIDNMNIFGRIVCLEQHRNIAI